MGCGASKDSHEAVITTTTSHPKPSAAIAKQGSAVAPNSISAVVAAKHNTDMAQPIQKTASIAPSEAVSVPSRPPMLKDVKEISAVGVVAVSSSFVENAGIVKEGISPIVEGVAAVVEGTVAVLEGATAVMVDAAREVTELVGKSFEDKVSHLINEPTQ